MSEIDLISRQAAISELMEWVEKEKNKSWSPFKGLFHWTAIKAMLGCLPSAQPEIIRCEDCVFGYRYFDVHNGSDTDSWVECRNPDGLNRDVSVDGYCYAAVRRKDDE